MDWDNPQERLALIERVGIAEYNRLFEAHVAATIVATVNGYSIRTITSGRWGPLFMVMDATGVAFRTVEEAKDHAAQLPPRDIKL